jgi:hypothetical protein
MFRVFREKKWNAGTLAPLQLKKYAANAQVSLIQPQ